MQDYGMPAKIPILMSGGIAKYSLLPFIAHMASV